MQRSGGEFQNQAAEGTTAGSMFPKFPNAEGNFDLKLLTSGEQNESNISAGHFDLR